VSKIYYHRTAGAKFYMPNGAEVAFAGGQFDSASITDKDKREAVELELNKIANVPASHVYTMETAPVSREEVDTANEIRESATNQFDQVNKIPGGTNTIPLPTQGHIPPVLNPQAAQQSQQQQQQQQNSGGGSGSVPVNIQDKLAAARAAVHAAPGGNVAGANAGNANTPNKTS
jgi:hypothetical protein